MIEKRVVLDYIQSEMKKKEKELERHKRYNEKRCK